MSKHTNAEGKLHIPGSLRRSAAIPAKQPLVSKEDMAPQVPAKGTNANNQYR
jgi:hypothetical protein